MSRASRPTPGSRSTGGVYRDGIVIAVVAPIVEDLTFRASAIPARPVRRWTAITAQDSLLRWRTAWSTRFRSSQRRIGLAYLRSRVDSVYPEDRPGLFNAIALTVAVSGKPQADILGACAAAWPVLSLF